MLKKLKSKLQEMGILNLNVIPSIIAIIAGIYSALSGSVDCQLRGISVVLTSLTGSLIIQYISSINRMDDRTKKLAEKLGEADIFQYARSTDFWDYARDNGEKLFISGGSLYNVFADRSGYLNDLLSKGKKIYVVIMKPESTAIKLLYENVVNSQEVSDSEVFKNHTKETIRMLHGLQEKFPRQIDIGFNDQVPSFGIFASLKADEPIRIQVNLFSEKINYDKRIAMIVSKDDTTQQDAYLYFKNQINLIKNRCRPASQEEINMALQ